MNSPSNLQPPTSADPLNLYFRWPTFLASSWTWCIGLYLPVLLLERYGWAAVAAFAVPNLAGIVLFPMWFGTRRRSRAFRIAQSKAMFWFSAVTIAFHGYFLGWFWYAEFGLTPGVSIIIGIIILLMAFVSARLPVNLLVSAASSVWIVSALLFVLSIILVWPRADVANALNALQVWSPSSSSSLTWLWLVPIMAFGFLMCPWLDLTFHRAYDDVGGGVAGRQVFVGFAIVFALMLGFSCYYAARGFAWPALVHIILQAWITVTLHVREMRESQRASDRRVTKTPFVIPFIICSLAPTLLIDYRDWYAFYGIIFPAAVLLLGLPRLVGRRAVSPSLFLILIAASIPFGISGFLADREWTLIIPPVLVVLIGVLAVGGGPPAAPSEDADTSTA